MAILTDLLNATQVTVKLLPPRGLCYVAEAVQDESPLFIPVKAIRGGDLEDLLETHPELEDQVELESPGWIHELLQLRYA